MTCKRKHFMGGFLTVSEDELRTIILVGSMAAGGQEQCWSSGWEFTSWCTCRWQRVSLGLAWIFLKLQIQSLETNLLHQKHTSWFLQNSPTGMQTFKYMSLSRLFSCKPRHQLRKSCIKKHQEALETERCWFLDQRKEELKTIERRERSIQWGLGQQTGQEYTAVTTLKQ